MLSTLAFAGLTVATMGDGGLTDPIQAAAAPTPLRRTAFFDDQSDPVCTQMKTNTDDDNVLLECARFNSDGKPFGDTQKQMAWVRMCSDDQELNDLKLSIANRLFGGEGLDGKLTSGDCEAECVYSLANKDIETSCSRTVSGLQCPDYMAYHWNNNDACWESKTADWCLQNVEMPRYMELGTGAALAWEFPAFKVKSFCSASEAPTPKPTSSPESVPSEPLTPSNLPEGCVITDDDYNCPRRYMLGFCNMSEAVSASFKAKCPNCCSDGPSEKPAPTAGTGQ